MNVRNALLRSLAVSLIRDGKIMTTSAKAKAVKPLVERLLTKAKTGDLAAKRFVNAKLGPVCGRNLVEVVAPKYKNRAGGYLRIIRLNDRKSDAAEMVQIEFV